MSFFTSTVSDMLKWTWLRLYMCVYVCMYATFIYLFSGLDYRIVCFGKQVVSSI